MNTSDVLARWCRSRESNQSCSVVCIGDSITFSPAMPAIGVTRSWVAQLASALDSSTANDGFRGLWYRDEWARTGEWTRPQDTDRFDVAPFGSALYSSGDASDRLTWTKPAAARVEAFELYGVVMPGTGRGQYRVDDADWHPLPEPRERNGKLDRFFVHEHVGERVEIRGRDGTHGCVITCAGIRTYSEPMSANRSAVVHNLGHQQETLATFCRETAGDPLAVLDVLRPDLVVVLFSNDVGFRDADRFSYALKAVIRRVGGYADALLMTPFEQRTCQFVRDAATRAGASVVSSPTALFVPTDRGSALVGTNIAPGTRIWSVNSHDCITMTKPATGSSATGELLVRSRRDAMAQATYRAFTKAVADAEGCALLDLHELWTRAVGGGWDNAYAAGLMADGLHPTQKGHDLIASAVCELLGVA